MGVACLGSLPPALGIPWAGRERQFSWAPPGLTLPPPPPLPAGCLVRELIDFLGIKRRVTRPVLHLLLVPQLTELDLGRCSQLVTKDVAQMISSRCKVDRGGAGGGLCRGAGEEDGFPTSSVWPHIPQFFKQLRSHRPGLPPRLACWISKGLCWVLPPF